MQQRSRLDVLWEDEIGDSMQASGLTNYKMGKTRTQE